MQYEGRRYRILTIRDAGTREGLAVEADIFIPSARVVRVLEELTAVHGRPAAFRVDNSPELTAEHFGVSCTSQGIAIHDIQLGKTDQNADIERFNRSYLPEVLDAYLVESISEVHQLTASASFTSVQRPDSRNAGSSARTQPPESG
jgi:putative transposase